MITNLQSADNGTYQVITHNDPVTGKVIKDIVHTTIDPESGETVEIPVDVPLGIWILPSLTHFLFNFL